VLPASLLALNTGSNTPAFLADLIYSNIEFSLAAACDKNISALVNEPLCCGAVARPMPLLPPVTTAVFASSRFVFNSV
jgi:hypothetical protein